MEIAHKFSRTGFLLTAALLAVSAHADPINIQPIDDPGAVEGFELDALSGLENPLSSVSYSPGSISFQDGDGKALAGLDPGNDPLHTTDWWQGDDLIYTTATDTMEVTFSDLYVVAFTFRLGANRSAQAWIQAEYSDDTGAHGSLNTGWFSGIGPDSSPAWGVFVADQGNCRKLDRVTIDPPFTWGLGEMHVATSDSCSVSVPEPGSLGLLGAGLLALGFVWHTRRRDIVRV